jgi:hypothetical protein
MRKIYLPFCACLFISISAIAVADEKTLVNFQLKNSFLGTQAQLCVLAGLVVVMQRNNLLDLLLGTEKGERKFQACVTEGKESVKTTQAEIRNTYKKDRKEVPTELTDWSLEWVATFDAIVPQKGEYEQQYISRAQGIIKKTELSVKKYERATE